ncbi:MAG: hypothetical protein ACOC32_02420, partial [Nanoarchaeota archaeon]
MATFQGMELLSNFAAIFTFLFMFAVTYGVLSMTQMFGEKNNKTLNPIIAFAVSILAAFTPSFVGIMMRISPMFVMAVMIAFFILIILRFLGVPQQTIEDFFKGDNKQKQSVIYWVIIVVILIVTLGISLEVGEEVGPYLGGGNASDVDDTEIPDAATDGEVLTETS